LNIEQDRKRRPRKNESMEQLETSDERVEGDKDDVKKDTVTTASDEDEEKGQEGGEDITDDTGEEEIGCKEAAEEEEERNSLENPSLEPSQSGQRKKTIKDVIEDAREARVQVRPCGPTRDY
jgi:hypothetical protein